MADDRDRQDAREAFRALGAREKLDHIITYYKWPIIIGLVALIIVGVELNRFLSRKESRLYLALVNVAVGSDFESALDGGFIETLGLDSRKNEVYIYGGLYLASDAEGETHKSVYASRIKLMAAVESKSLDAVLMSRSAYDILSGDGYLAPLDYLADDAVLSALICENEVVVEDNEIEYTLRETDERIYRTESAKNALILELPGFEEPVYLGFIANSPRSELSLEYARYLAGLA